jgi:hypothetical protein
MLIIDQTTLETSFGFFDCAVVLEFELRASELARQVL